MQSQPFVDVSWLVDVVTSTAYERLRDISEVLAQTTSNNEKKAILVNYFEQTQRRLLRLLVLLKWTPHLPLSLKCHELLQLVGSKDMCFQLAADSIAHSHAMTLVNVRTPVYDVNTAVDMLTTGTYTRLPSVISECVPPSAPSDLEREAARDRLHHVLRIRLLTATLPSGFTSISIENGQVLLKSKVGFQLAYTIDPHSDSCVWELVNVKIFVAAVSQEPYTTQASCDSIVRLLRSRMVAGTHPFEDHYTVLHHFCIALQMDLLRSQSRVLLKSSPEAIVSGVDYHTNTHALTVTYWNMNDRYRNATKHAIVVSESKEGVIVVNHSPALAEDERPFHAVDPTSVCLSSALLAGVRSSAYHRLHKFYKQLIADEASFPHPSHVTLSDDAVTIDLGEEFVVVSVDSRTGRFVVKDSLDTGCLASLEDKLSADKPDKQVIMSLKHQMFGYSFNCSLLAKGLENRTSLPVVGAATLFSDFDVIWYSRFPRFFNQGPLHSMYFVLHFARDVPHFSLILTKADGSNLGEELVRQEQIILPEDDLKHKSVPKEEAVSESVVGTKRARVDSDGGHKVPHVHHDWNQKLSKALIIAWQKVATQYLVYQFEHFSVSMTPSAVGSKHYILNLSCAGLASCTLSAAVLTVRSPVTAPATPGVACVACTWQVKLMDFHCDVTSIAPPWDGKLCVAMLPMSNHDNEDYAHVHYEAGSLTLSFSHLHNSSSGAFLSALQAVDTMAALAGQLEHFLINSPWKEHITVSTISLSRISLIVRTLALDQGGPNVERAVDICWGQRGLSVQVSGAPALSSHLEHALHHRTDLNSLLEVVIVGSCVWVVMEQLCQRPDSMTRPWPQEWEPMLPADFFFVCCHKFFTIRLCYRIKLHVDFVISQDGSISAIDAATVLPALPLRNNTYLYGEPYPLTGLDAFLASKGLLVTRGSAGLHRLVSLVHLFCGAHIARRNAFTTLRQFNRVVQPSTLITPLNENDCLCSVKIGDSKFAISVSTEGTVHLAVTSSDGTLSEALSAFFHKVVVAPFYIQHIQSLCHLITLPHSVLRLFTSFFHVTGGSALKLAHGPTSGVIHQLELSRVFFTFAFPASEISLVLTYGANEPPLLQLWTAVAGAKGDHARPLPVDAPADRQSETYLLASFYALQQRAAALPQ